MMVTWALSAFAKATPSSSANFDNSDPSVGMRMCLYMRVPACDQQHTQRVAATIDLGQLGSRFASGNAARAERKAAIGQSTLWNRHANICRRDDEDRCDHADSSTSWQFQHYRRQLNARQVAPLTVAGRGYCGRCWMGGGCKDLSSETEPRCASDQHEGGYGTCLEPTQ